MVLAVEVIKLADGVIVVALRKCVNPLQDSLID